MIPFNFNDSLISDYEEGYCGYLAIAIKEILPDSEYYGLFSSSRLNTERFEA